jgi:cytidine deaminase
MSARQHKTTATTGGQTRRKGQREPADERERLLAMAHAAAQHAYAPYSRFRVGAAVIVETPSGPEVVTGANVENASFGLTLCAERAALAAACLRVPPVVAGVSPQRPRVTHVAIACVDAPDDAPPAGRMPCGACRQWLAELAPDAVYYVDGVPQELRLEDLLPFAFHLAE